MNKRWFLFAVIVLAWIAVVVLGVKYAPWSFAVLGGVIILLLILRKRR